MAILYVRNDGSNTSPYDTWAKAATTLVTATAAASDGDSIYVGDGHSEAPTATQTHALGTKSLDIVCVNDTGDPEPPTAAATGALIATGAGSYDIQFTASSGRVYIYGLTLSPADGAGGSQNVDVRLASGGSPHDFHVIFEDCTFKLHTHNSCTFDFSAAQNDGEQYLECINCTFTFGATGQQFYFGVPKARIRGGSIGGTAPTTLIDNPSATRALLCEFMGVDLSAVTGTLVGGTEASGDIRFIDCKLGAGVTIDGYSHARPGLDVYAINCDSADTNYRYHRQNSLATETQETTVVLDASDGTTTFSRKVVTTANAKEVTHPYRSAPIALWNETIGSSQTATIEIVTDNVTLQDDECWLELEYLGTSGFPLGVFADDRAADILATPANQTTSSASWTTTGLTTPVKQALAVSFTAQEKGLIRASVCVAKPSTTVYYNPKIDLT